MKRFLKSKIAVVVLAIGFVLAGPASAASAYVSGVWAWGYTSWGCWVSGGSQGVGQIGSSVFIKETGQTGTKNFQVNWYRDYLGTDRKWHQDRSWQMNSANFADNTTSYHWGYNASWGGTAVAHYFPFTMSDLGTYRLRVDYHWRGTTLGVWHDKHKQTVTGSGCTPSDGW
jgi:hypothetical protein